MNVDVRVGESLRLKGAGNATITLEHKSGQRARLRVEADEAIDIQPPARGTNLGEFLAQGA